MTQLTNETDVQKPRPALHIVIDSKTYEVFDRTWQADALLRLAGLDPTQYDLTRVVKHEVETYRDSDVIKIKDGEEFESLRQSGSVA
jgi:hypothetical protein